MPYFITIAAYLAIASTLLYTGASAAYWIPVALGFAFTMWISSEMTRLGKRQ